jgi:hypothetical protein
MSCAAPYPRRDLPPERFRPIINPSMVIRFVGAMVAKNRDSRT